MTLRGLRFLVERIDAGSRPSRSARAGRASHRERGTRARSAVASILDRGTPSSDVGCRLTRSSGPDLGRDPRAAPPRSRGRVTPDGIAFLPEAEEELEAS